VLVGRQTRVLVTGASRGIGRATAAAFAEKGCALGLLARSEAELEQLASELRSAASVHAVAADVADRQAVAAALERFAGEAGGLDVIVANAGLAYYGPFRELPPEEAERMTAVNWLGTLWTVQAALPHLLGRGAGRIVVVSSAAGHRSFPSAAVYGATKAAQKAFLEALRHELAGTGVGVTGVYPGEVKTHLHDDDRAHDRMPDWYRGSAAIPPERVAAEIVEAVERDRASVFVPPNTRLLRIVHGLSPRLADRMLRAIMGEAAAPAR
jgi:short-subunit dehydrogenase